MKTVFMAFVFVFVSAAAVAGVPRMLTMQSMIYDADGNITANELVDVTVRIRDENDNIAYSETHTAVPVVKGAVNLMIGSVGSDGGIPLDVLDPALGGKYIDVIVDGADPFETMPLSAVPYAMWAEKCVTVPDDSIESRHIRNGGIRLEDLEPGIAFSNIAGTASDEQIPATVARDAELSNHFSSGSAHNASAVVVSGNFQTIVAVNVEDALEKLDGKLGDEVVNRRSSASELGRQVTNEANDRRTADTTLQNSINAEAASRVEADFSEAAAREVSDTSLTLYVNNEIAVRGMEDAGLQRQIDGKLSRTGDDTMSGNLNVNSITTPVGSISHMNWLSLGGYSGGGGFYDGVSGLFDLHLNAEKSGGTGGFVIFYVQGDEKMRVTDAGTVGIGTRDPGGDKLDVRGRAYAEGGWQATDADYAEWFEKEGDATGGDIIGVNLETGMVRKYRPGDRFLGICSANPAFVGNRQAETDEEMSDTHLLVGLLGQLDFNRDQTRIEGRVIKTIDGAEIGVLLNNGKAMVGR